MRRKPLSYSPVCFFPFFFSFFWQTVYFVSTSGLLLIHYWEYNLFGYLIFFFLSFSAFLSRVYIYRNSRHKYSHAPACHGENSDPSLSWFHFGKRVIKRAFQKYTRDPISASSSSSSTLGRTMLIFLFFFVFPRLVSFISRSSSRLWHPPFLYSFAGDRGWMNVRLHWYIHNAGVVLDI